jgi:hypothetical protein
LRLAIFIMDDCQAKSLHRNSQQISRRTSEVSDLCLISLAGLMTRVTQEKKMDYNQQKDQASKYQSNFRAEDGLPTGPSNALYEGVVVPLASLFAVVLFVVGAMVISH